jgi:hypothetical protein
MDYFYLLQINYNFKENKKIIVIRHTWERRHPCRHRSGAAAAQ